MPLEGDDQQDQEALTRLLVAIGRFLDWIVRDSLFVPEDLRPGFLDVLLLVNSRLETARNELEAIMDTDSPLWQRLDDAGLVGVPLRLKLAIWRRTTATVSSASPAFVGRALRPLMKLINSILGSLASVFHLLELAKEYKDCVEVVVDHQQQGNPPPIDIFNI